MATSTHFLAGKKIVVAGGGVAGLSFAIALRRLWPSARAPTILIYERDARVDAEGREGYSMSLRSDLPGGIQALHKLGVLDEMRDVAVAGATANNKPGFCIWDSNWRTVMKIATKPPAGLPVAGLRVQRSKMRRVLVDAAARAGCEVTWGVGCTGIERREDGRFAVKLDNATVDVADLVVAADGSRSKLREAVRPHDKLTYQGVHVIGATARFGDKPPPKPLDLDWGPVVTGSGVGLFCSVVDQHSALWSLSWRSSTPLQRKAHPLSDKEKYKLMGLADLHRDLFPPLFGKLLDATDLDTLMAFNANDKAPFAHTDAAWSGVVFVGDANHAISPFAGNGANMALCDGWDLAEQLCIASSVDEAVKKYDAMVVPRSTQVRTNSHRAINLIHSEGWWSWCQLLVFRVVGFLFFRGSKSEEPE